MAPFKFGILMIPFQTLDAVGPIDLLSSSSQEYLRGMEEAGGPLGLADKGIDIEFLYIGETLDPVEHTASFRSFPNTTLATCPPLDYLLVGGPDPRWIAKMPPAFAEFIRARAEEVKILFTTCTGGMVVAATGVLTGKNATTNHVAVPVAQQIMPHVNWTAEKQWVVDGKFWTAGGACAGMDMIASWILENYPVEVAKAGFDALDFQPRDVHRKPLPV